MEGQVEQLDMLAKACGLKLHVYRTHSIRQYSSNSILIIRIAGGIYGWQKTQDKGGALRGCLSSTLVLVNNYHLSRI